MSAIALLLQAALALMMSVASNPMATVQDRQQALNVAFSAVQAAQAYLQDSTATSTPPVATSTPLVVPATTPVTSQPEITPIAASTWFRP
jgi:hypothetical protein